MIENLAIQALRAGGRVRPLIIPSELHNGQGLMNPSIHRLSNGKLAVILRSTNYTFYHSEKKILNHPWGPLTYIHPENDMHLRTINYYCELDNDLNITRANKIDTSQFDNYEPKWNFVGLEDARLFEWNGKLYTSGVRRDTTPNGQGRMELCEIVVEPSTVTEVSRFRIPPPKDLTSYCEKNWMPVVDLPYHYVKWSNPTELVLVDPLAETARTEKLTPAKKLPRDIRGGSQVIPWGNYRLALTHEVGLFKSEVNRKDGIYYHRFLLWDLDWNLVGASDNFFIMGAHIEFAVGMCEYDEKDILFTFGFQDNAAYTVQLPRNLINSLIREL